MKKRVEDIMKKDVHTIPPETTIGAAREFMSTNQIRHLPILAKDTGRLIGIISDRDVKKFLSPFAGSASASERDNATLKIKVEKIMTKEILTCTVGDGVRGLVEIILQKKIGCVPILNKEEKLVGVITNSDLLRLLLAVI